MRSSTAILSEPKRRREMPASLEPMLAMSAPMPSRQQDFTFEYKWDGVRALCYISKDRFEFQSRNQLVITHRYPELAALEDAFEKTSVILDGEIVSLDENARPSFAKLQRRMHLNSPREIESLSRFEPVFYILFDVLHLNGKSLLNEPLVRRREILEELTLAGSNWQITPAHVGEGTAMLENARRSGLEGVVAKKLDSTYLPGKRSADWIKLKIIQRQEFVIGGFVPERSGVADRVGAILIGYFDCHGELRYAGKVGTGLSAADHSPLMQKLKRHSLRISPFADAVPSGAQFCKPALVAEIEYRRWPENGLLQHASFKGLRTDKPAREVVKEPPGIELT